MEFYRYDPKTFAYMGAGIGETLPAHATITPVTGLTGNIIYHPDTNGWTGDAMPDRPDNLPSPDNQLAKMVAQNTFDIMQLKHQRKEV